MSEPTATPVAPAAPSAEPSAPAAKHSKKRLLLIGVGALPLVLGGVVFAALRGRGEPVAPERVRAEPGVLVLEPFVVNLGADTGRFLKCTVHLELAAAADAERIQAEPLTLLRVQDGLLSVLSCASAESVAEAGGKDALRAALLRRAREALPETRVAGVYFREFLFQ